MKQKFCLFFFTLILFAYHTVLADTSNISNLIFVSTAQSVGVSEISEEIKVQTQNSLGATESVSETNDVTFTSSSVTGEFLNSTGNTATKTMSKNTSSRTFYYRDSTSGTFVLTISVKGRDTGKTFSATQNITIGGSTSGGSDGSSTTTATTTQNSSTTTPSVVNTNSDSQILSAHSVTENVTYITNIPDLKVDAGRHRLATTHTQIEFDAKSSGIEDWLGGVKFVWSFGDGTVESGKKVSHTYLFSGDYIVVLNVTGNNSNAVSRTEVKVVDSNIRISNMQRGKNGFVEVRNDSEFEANIQDWKIVNGREEMVLPRDTIIGPKSNLKIPFRSSEFGTVTLEYSKGEINHVASSAFVEDIVAYHEPTREEIEIAKQKVARQFALENSQVSLNSKTFNPQSLNSETWNTKISSPVISSTTPGGTSIIDSLNTAKGDDNSPLLASPFKMFQFLKNFFTK